MEAFRTLIKGWLGKVLLVLFLTPLALVGIEGYFAGSPTKVAIEVNDQEITEQEVENWIKSQKDQYLQAVNGDETLLNTKVIENQVYDAAIVRALLLQQAKTLGIQLTDDQLGNLLRQQNAFQQDGKFSQTLLENYLNGTKTTIAQLLADFRQQSSLTLLTNGILSSSIYSSKDTDQLIGLLSQERTTHLAEISLNDFANDFVPSEQQIKAYYDQNVKNYVRAANVDVAYLTLNKAQFSENIQITQQDIQNQYQAYVTDLSKDAKRDISHILITLDNRSANQATQLAEQISNKLKAGESFDALVKQYSEDPISKTQSGKIDGYSVGAFGEDFDKAVLALQKGQVSAPVKTDYGYHLIRLDQINAKDIPALAQVQDQLVSEIKTKKAEDAYQDAIGQANDMALQTDSLEAVAEQYKVQVLQSKNVSKLNRHPILSDAAVKLKLFSEDVENGDRNVSTGISLKNGDTVWFKVMEYRAERPQTLAEAKATIQDKLKREEQVKQAEASVKALLVSLNTKTVSEALAGSTVKFQNIGPIPRYSQVLPPELERAVYALAAPKPGYWSAQTVALGEYLFVVAVSEIGQNPAFQLTDEQKKQVVTRYDHRGQQELNDYIEYLRSKADINTKKK